MSKLETNTIDTISGSTDLQLGSTNATIIKANNKILFNNSGDGIYLGVTSATASNLLDDYEEGTWTPTFFGSITAGTYTFDAQVGYYTKIGNVVHAAFELININTSSAGSGNAVIGGLPFTPASGRPPLAQAVWLSRFNLSTDSDYQIQVEDSIGTNIYIRRMTSGASGVGAYLDITDKASNLADIYTQFTYLTS